MPDLSTLVRSYLESMGFRILREQGYCLVADKLAFGQERDTWLVWTLPAEVDPASCGEALRQSIAELRPNYPDAKAYVLSQSRLGFPRDLLHFLAESRVYLRVPVQFFDAAFKVEEAPKAASAISDIRALAKAEKRVPQPFVPDDGPTAKQEDLLRSLRRELSQPHGPGVHVIVGRAGIGKSFLFRALFENLYGNFLLGKQKQVVLPRPIPLLPDHLKGAYALRTEMLLDNFLRTDVAAPVSRDTFEWLLVNGFATWLLDGLDELYAGDPGFFDHILDYVTRPNSMAQVVICCRDSVLTTSDAFSDFREYCTGSAALKVYRLLDWDSESKRQFAWLRLTGEFPRPGAPEPKEVAAFMAAIDSNGTLRALSGLPFYCDLLLEQHRAGGLGQYADGVSFLNHAVDAMVRREIDKGLIDLGLFEPNGLNDWLEQIALDYVGEQRYSGINRDTAREYGEFVLQAGLDEGVRHHILTSLLQFPLFRGGTESGSVAFAHDLVAEALAARAYLRELPKQPRATAERLAKIDLEDSMLLRFMAGSLSANGENALVNQMRQGQLSGEGFAAALSLLLLAKPDRDLVKRLQISLEGQALKGVHFLRRDLSGLSFRLSDMSHVKFTDCDLTEARFEGAFLARTTFDQQTVLSHAQFGDLSRIQSIVVGKKLLDEPGPIRAWVENTTSVVPPPVDPCPTALQVVHMFRKYITPLGEARRDYLAANGLLAGKRYPGSASPEECLREAVSAGYLSAPDYRGRHRRAEGDRYAEMVGFVSRGHVSDGLGRLISGLCRRRGCLHRLS